MSYYRTGADTIVNPFIGLNLDAISAGSQSNNQIAKAFGTSSPANTPPPGGGPPVMAASGSIPWLWIGGGVAVLVAFGLLRKKK